MDFDEVRPYQPGDDVRQIDWNVSARQNAPFVKTFREERELTVMLIVDISGDKQFGTRSLLKAELAAELAAVVAFSAIVNNDKVGLILVSDSVEHFVPPRKGKKHVLRVVRDILTWKPVSSGKRIEAGLEYLSRITRRKAVVFVVSDMYARGWEPAMRIARRRNDLNVFQVVDPLEQSLIGLGQVPFQDPKTGEIVWKHTGGGFADRFNKAARKNQVDLERTLRRMKVDFATFPTHEAYATALVGYFKRKASRLR
jgi:uncharacterized protein (DUF58 family)